MKLKFFSLLLAIIIGVTIAVIAFVGGAAFFVEKQPGNAAGCIFFCILACIWTTGLFKALESLD